MKEKKYFTEEQIARLKEAEYYFATSVRENFKRGTMINNLVATVYEEATGERLNPNWTCANCCLNNYKTAGRLYFESIEHWKEVKEETEVTNTQSTGLQLTFDFEPVEKETEPALKTNELEKPVSNTAPKNNNTPKPKRGRPKKQNKNL